MAAKIADNPFHSKPAIYVVRLRTTRQGQGLTQAEWECDKQHASEDPMSLHSGYPCAWRLYWRVMRINSDTLVGRTPLARLRSPISNAMRHCRNNTRYASHSPSFGS